MNHLFKQKTIYFVDEYAVKKSVVSDTADARQIHWSRLIKSIEKNMKFIRPISMSDDAIKKRIQRRS